MKEKQNSASQESASQNENLAPACSRFCFLL